MKKMSGSMASESLLEEGPQAAIQRYETKKAMGETDMGWLEGYATEWVNNFYIPEGQKAMYTWSNCWWSLWCKKQECVMHYKRERL